MEPSIDQRSRTSLDADFKSIIKQISQVIKSAQFDGANLLDGSAGATIQFLASADASQTITLSSQDLSFGGSIMTLAATASIGTASAAASIMSALETSMENVNQALGNMGAQARQIAAHTSFVSKLSDTLEAGVGNLVDADLARESARLQALQVQQQLGVQALSIANQAPQVILSLFK
jgi:flagellin